MSTTMMSSSQSLLISGESPPHTTEDLGQSLDVEFAKCDCCGLTEECTISYIETIQERYQGKWICGLCAEAIKDEASRCESSDEALSRHLSFCKTFQSSITPPSDPTIDMIAAMRHVLRRSLESPRMRSLPCSPTTKANRAIQRWTRSEICLPPVSLVDDNGDDRAGEVA